MSEWSKEGVLRTSGVFTSRVRTPLSAFRTHSSGVERKLSKLEVRGSKPFECIIIKRMKHVYIMNAARIHDVVTVTFLVPYSTLTLAEVFFGYVVYPMFLTYALTFHILYDLIWIYLQPKIIKSYRKLIILHHIVTLIYLLRPLLNPTESRLTSLVSLVEIDTTILILRRLLPKSDFMNNLYLVSNLFIRVYYETFLSFIVWFLSYNYTMWSRIHVLVCQLFINVFSCGICALTFSKNFKKTI